MPLSPAGEQRAARKARIAAWADATAAERDRWIQRNAFYYDDDRRYMRFLVRPGQRVLEIGCGTGQLLAALEPSRGVGLDVSEQMIAQARRLHPDLDFRVGDIEDADTVADLGGPFDVIIMSDVVGYLEDIQRTLESLHAVCTPDTRLVVAYFSQAWRPILDAGERIGLKMPQPQQNWLSLEDIESLLQIADFEPIKREFRLLLPKRLFGLGPLVNRYIGTLPVLRRLSLRHYVVARPQVVETGTPSLSVVIPCRNEAGNIEAAVQRLPQICDDMEIVFVEGNSTDDTVDEIKRVMAAYPDRDIVFAQQEGRGKGDAVRKGFAIARGDILIILDADLTVAPEDMPKFYDVLAEGRADYVQGTRLVYPLEQRSMRKLNFLGNHLFARVFSWLLSQRMTDTLCGTKALRREAYERLARERDYFGDFDPFGDFDLIFGASRLNLKVMEIPVRYSERGYGETQISRFSDGWLLLRMVAFAYRRLKAI